ncbi:MAG: hypothetical protein ACLT98_13535 [Eggerthellaceae bacterium]
MDSGIRAVIRYGDHRLAFSAFAGQRTVTPPGLCTHALLIDCCTRASNELSARTQMGSSDCRVKAAGAVR